MPEQDPNPGEAVRLDALLYGAGGPREYDRVLDVETPENFERNIRPLVEGMGNTGALTLHEGLPHQMWEGKLLAAELAGTRTVTLHGFPFYAGPIAPSESDAARLRTLCGQRETFGRYRGPKECGGYHPDWCIELTAEEGAYRVLVCYGCHEARLYGPEYEVWSDLGKGSLEHLVEVMNPYRKNRPAPGSKQ